MASTNPFLVRQDTDESGLAIVTHTNTFRSSGSNNPTGTIENIEAGASVHPSGRGQQGSGLFSNAGRVRLDGATFSSVAGNVYNVTHTNAQSSQALIQHVPHHPEHESETYARLLFPKRNGYPIWYPPPRNSLPEEYRRNGVAIGDVGIVTAYGSFDFLFNICLPAEHPINGNRVPDGFVPIEPSLETRDIESIPDAWKAGSHVSNGAIQVITHPLDPNNGGSERYTFQCQQFEGAILTLPKGGRREDLLDLVDFQHYAGKHAIGWYRYINQRRGRNAANGSVYLVTGYDKTRTWGTASFAGITVPGTFPLSFTARTPTHRVTTYSHLWDQSGPASTKEGPPIEHDRGDADRPENQCTFIRGFKVALGESIWAGIFGKVEVHPLTGQDPAHVLQKSSFIPFSGATSGLMGYFGFSGASGSAGPRDDGSSAPSSTGNGVQITSVIPQPSTDIHPSSGINKYLLTAAPDAAVAITHDRIWISVIKDDETEIPELHTLLSRLELLYNLVTEDGVVSLFEIPATQQTTEGKNETPAMDALPFSSPYYFVAEEHSQKIRLLCKAARGGDCSTVASLLDENFDFNARNDDDGYTPLSWATGEGHIAIVKMFLSTPTVDPDYPCLNRKTPFFYAAEFGYDDVVSLLLEDGRVNLNAKNMKGETPLSIAAHFGWRRVVQLLLKHEDTDFNSQDEDGVTALMKAAKRGYGSVADLLLQRDDLLPNLQCSYGDTALIYAARHGYEKVVKVLLQFGQIDVNIRNRDGYSALAVAVQKGHNEVVRLLIGRPGIHADARDGEGLTPLLSAVCNRHAEIVAILLARDKDHLPRSTKGDSAALLESGTQDDIINLWHSQKKINLNARDEDGRTPLMLAARQGDEDTLAPLLLQNGVDVNLRSTSGLTALIYAAEAGHEGVVEHLLGCTGIKINIQTNQGDSALSRAASRGHEGVVALLLRMPEIEVNLPNKREETPFLAAVSHGREKIVSLLLDSTSFTSTNTTPAPRRQIDVNARDADGRTALAKALLAQDSSIVKMLLEMPEVRPDIADNTGTTPLELVLNAQWDDTLKTFTERDDVDLSARNSNGETPLLHAVTLDYPYAVDMLLEKGVDINAGSDTTGHTPLWVAAYFNRAEIVDKLLSRGHNPADPNPIDDLGRTPLHCAASRGGQDVVKVLVRHKTVDLHARTKAGLTALHLAAANGHLEIVKLLLDQDPSLLDAKADKKYLAIDYATHSNHVDVFKYILSKYTIDEEFRRIIGRRLLLIAARNGQLSIADILLQHACDPNGGNEQGSTPLSIAAEMGDLSMVEKLLQSEGIDPNAQAMQGLTPLLIAIDHGKEEIVNLLLDHPNVDRNCQDWKGRSPLAAAVRKGHASMVATLLLRNANPNAKDNHGRTPLAYAAEDGNAGMVEILLQHSGVDRNVKDRSGKTAFDLAQKKGHGEVMKLLSPVDPPSQKNTETVPPQASAIPSQIEPTQTHPISSSGLDIASDVLSWTSQDPRESQLFNSWGIMYRFHPDVRKGTNQTTLWRSIRPNKEDRVANLEWSSTGGLGKILIGKNTMPMADLVRSSSAVKGERVFSGPDGFTYRWRPNTTGQDINLLDNNGNVIAYYRPVRPTRYQLGDVYGELHFQRTAGAGIVMHPPFMDYVVLTIMLYRFCAQWNL